MKLATPLQIKQIDADTISSGYAKAIDLMEKAGHAVAREAEQLTAKNENISIFCGKGNNGGDGLVSARYLLKKSRKTQVYLFAKKNELKREPAKNLERFIKLKGRVIEITSINDFKKLEQCRRSSLFIDALLGIGLNGKVIGLMAQAINLINSFEKRVISVDVPSGLDAEKGIPLGVCIKAFETVTLGLAKTGLFLSPGINYAGKVKIVNIGLSPESIQQKKLSHHLIEREEVSALLPKRSLDSHKGDCGHALIIAGSTGLTGAACLASLGALRSGAGLVTLGLPKSINTIAASKLTEVMTKPLPEKNGALSCAALPVLKDFSKRCRAIAIGPGLSRNTETAKLVFELIKTLTIPMVIDADALFALSKNPNVLKKAKASLILTPHLGEMARLIKKTPLQVKDNKLEIVRSFTKKYNVIVVLKGAGTIIACPDGDVFINPTGNPCLSTGGTGDVLTGMITSFLCQGLKPIDAAKLGVYLHGITADELSLSRGPWGIIASDILSQLPFTMHNLAVPLR